VYEDAGFDSEDIDMKGWRVAFRRVRPEASRTAAARSVSAAAEDRHPLVGWNTTADLPLLLDTRAAIWISEEPPLAC
jgi:hypothetical protein